MFMISSIIQALLLKLIFSPICVIKKRNDKESMISLTTETKPKFLHLLYTKQRIFFFLTEKELFKEKRMWKIEQKTKWRPFHSSRYGD